MSTVDPKVQERLAKVFAWRIVSTISTFSFAFLLLGSHDWRMAGAVALVMAGVQMCVHFVFETVWERWRGDGRKVS